MGTELLECGVDWITCTWDIDMPASIVGMVEEDFHFNTEGRKGKWLQYTGMTTREAFFGTSPSGYLLRLSGGSAFSFWHRYAGSAKHVSRLDIQATVRLNSCNRELAAQMSQSASVAAMDNQNYPQRRLISSFGRGDTFSLGDRSSDTYLRIYDKELESGEEEYKECWRFELEHKAGRAKQVALHLLQVPSVPIAINTLLLGHCHEYGLWIPVPPLGVPMRIPAIRRERDDDKSLRWLDTQVRATVARLIDNGRIEEVYYALGLKADRDGYGR